MTQPIARVEIVRDTHFGTTIEDPYRWLEELQDDEARAWLQAQAAHTRAYLDALPERPALLADIETLGDAGSSLSHIAKAGGRTFYMRRDTGENLGKLVVRVGDEAPERVLIDPNTFTGDVHSALDWYFPSPDGKLVAYGVSPGGSEDSVLHILDAESGVPNELAIPGAQFGSAQWLPEGDAFVYHRINQPGPDDVPGARYANTRSYLHRLGSDPAEDTPVLGHGVNPHIKLEPTDFPVVVLPAETDWMLGALLHGVQREVTLYAALRSGLSDPANCHWTLVCDVPDAISAFAVAGDTIYLRTHKDAPRFKIISTSLRAPDLAGAELVVPESAAVIEDLKVVGDALIVRDMDGGLARLRRIPLGGGTPEPVRLPFSGSILAPGGETDWASEQSSTDLLFIVESWTVAPRLLRLDVTSKHVEDTGWYPPSPVDTSDVEAHEVEVQAKDGTMVPLSIIHRKGLVLDGSNPALLRAYGSYGISLLPTFDPAMLAWYRRGGIYAIAHVRGGGEHGREWHEAGRLLNKRNTVDDFIACAEYLVQKGYTRRSGLAGAGRSAGGIPSGGALTARPDLWAVMFIEVGVTNLIRFENSENGPPNVPEFGSTATEEGFRALQLVDSYHQIKDGTPYPAVMVTTGLNDPRVVTWMATKMAARLQAATSSGRPVLLRVEEHAGHGASMGSTKSQVHAELADKLAFMLDQFGHS
ncbi:MAG: prolyl oligopeptidase family serine peptidase [Chloroflexota bacterium]|nr:prolyl oligopeptidase family serine peptidase [Chloroflexota bacterium]